VVPDISWEAEGPWEERNSQTTNDNFNLLILKGQLTFLILFFASRLFHLAKSRIWAKRASS
jgi:hypothetical protein